MSLRSVSSLRLVSNRRIQSAIQSNVQSRTFHITSSAKAISNFTMPAMSPTMTEGGVASWKVKDGQSFSAGDVLLEIETDKATMDVEAQEDGVMGKIIVQDGAKEVAVGKTIALLAEEGDDISNLEVPSEESSSSKPSSSNSDNKSSSSSSSAPSDPPATKSTPSPTSSATPSPSNSSSSSSHSHSSGPMFPSVSRLLSENNVSSKDSEKIKGTGVRGMLTKGDVLTYLGVVERPTGSFKEVKHGISALGGGAPTGSGKGGKPGEVKSEPLTPSTLRSLILSGLSSSSSSARSRLAAQSPVKPTSSSRSSSGIDELISDYEFGSTKKPSSSASKSKKDSFEGLF